MNEHIRNSRPDSSRPSGNRKPQGGSRFRDEDGPAAGKPRSAGFDARRGPGRAKKARAEAEPFVRRAIPDIDTAFTRMGIDARVAINLPPLGLNEPTPIQAQAIPSIVAGRDLLGLAQTGTGKTAAFSLPMLTRLLIAGKRPEPGTCRALILAPTRELATQIAQNVESYAQGTGLRAFRVVGGASINVQIDRLARGVDVLIATPGRLIDLIERKAIRFDDTSYLVLDEADQMLDIGFIHALRRIARLLPRNRQTLLFSATMPKLMEELADSYLTDPVRVEANPPGRPADKIAQGVHFVNQGDKATLLAEYLAKHPGELAIVFGRTKHGSDCLNCWRNGASRSPPSTATRARGSGNGRWPRSGPRIRRCWSPPMWPHAASTFRRSRMSITTTCRTCRRTMSTASAAPPVPAVTAAPWPSARPPSWASCGPSKRPSRPRSR